MNEYECRTQPKAKKENPLLLCRSFLLHLRLLNSELCASHTMFSTLRLQSHLIEHYSVSDSLFFGNKFNNQSINQSIANGCFRRRMLFYQVRSFFVFLRHALLPLQMRSQRQRRSSGSPRSYPFSLLQRRCFRQGTLFDLLLLFSVTACCYMLCVGLFFFGMINLI